MTDCGNAASVFQDALYRQTLAGARTLGRRLEEDSVHSLAREVIRRLNTHPPVEAALLDRPGEAEIARLCRALLQPDARAGRDFIDRVQAAGATVETIYLAYLRRAARLLGEWWEEDRITFAEVTMATGHIFAILRGFSHLFVTRGHVASERAALFFTVPGETHLMGVRMAADLLRNDGWDITLETTLDHDALVARAAEGGATVVGLSAAGDHALSALARLIVALRISAPQATVFVGGNVVAVARDTVRLMGPDGMAADFGEARAVLQRLCAEAPA